jgi:hypothetical protein
MVDWSLILKVLYPCAANRPIGTTGGVRPVLCSLGYCMTFLVDRITFVTP